MTFRSFLLLFIIAAAALDGAAPATTPSPLDLLVQKARSLEARDRADLAAQVWQQVLIANPRQPDALAGLARWAKRSGKVNEANSYISKLREIDPASGALIELASTKAGAQHDGRLDEAAKLAGEHRYDEALRIYHEVFGNNPPAGGWALAYYEAQAQTAKGFEPAIAALKKLSLEHPDYPDYQLTTGRLLTYKAATRESGLSLLAAIPATSPVASKSQEAWRQALLWEKGNRSYLPQFHDYLARYQDGEVQSAFDALKAQPAPAADEVYYSKNEQRGYSALKQNKVAEAEESFSSAVEENPHSPAALAGLGFVRMKQGDFAEAVEQFQAAQKQHPKSADLAQALETAKFWDSMQVATEAGKKNDAEGALNGYRTALSIRSNSPEALRGLAGTFMLAGQNAKAVETYQHLVHLQPKNAENWEGLIGAKSQNGDPASALQILNTLPATISAQLAQKLSFQILQTQIYADAGQDEQAARLFNKLITANAADASPDSQVQVANLMVRFHRPGEAADRMKRLVLGDPENLAACEALVSALAAQGKNAAAEAALDRMPEKARRAALAQPGFLQTVASIEAALGKPLQAKASLAKILDMPDGIANEKTKLGVKIQLAPLLAQTGQVDEAENLMKAVLEAYPANDAAWKSYLLLLGNAHRYSDVLSSAARLPEEVNVRLRNDRDVIGLLASAEAAEGNPDAGIRLLQTFIARSGMSGAVISPDLQIQLCWLLLNSRGKQRQLYRDLGQIRSRTDLTDAQRKDVSDIWINWIQRSADDAAKQGDLPRTMALLGEGLSQFPREVRLQRSLAGYLLKSGDSRRALNIYSNWGLADAGPNDYAGAIGAAMSQRNYQYADAWMEKALAKWPKNSQLLTLAGDRAKAKGDLKLAKLYWREAIQMRQSEPVAPTPDGTAQPSSRLASLLVGPDASSEPVPSKTETPDLSSVPSYGSAELDHPAPKAHLSSMQTGYGTDSPSLTPSSDLDDFSQPSTGAHSRPLKNLGAPGLVEQSLLSSEPTAADANSLEDRLASIEGRNTPSIGSQMTVQSRSGQAGFDRLLIQQADFEASSTIANTVRVSVNVRPTYLYAGTANGTSTLRFGTADVGSTFGPQTAGGVAADAQLSTQTFGLRFGSSPDGFLTRNVIGGLRFQPANGPVTFLVERDSVRDTMLSYAGARDSGSGQVWGGVVSNSASVLGHWGDDKSGIYASVGYASLSGREVARNQSVNGNFGTYWKIFTRKEGSLTLGTNFSAMHYDKNLRFFTLGQGGYFSPQQYFLFGVPFRWTGTYGNRTQYMISGSLGTQHFQEDASPFFPLDPNRKPGDSYGAEASTGANFSFDARVNYQLAPHWFLGVWADANNARNYTSSSAGLFVKYVFQPKPLGFDNSVPSVPDWHGQQPFNLF